MGLGGGFSRQRRPLWTNNKTTKVCCVRDIFSKVMYDGYVRHESASFDIAFFNKGWGLTFTITCQLSVVTIIQLWVGTTPNKIFLFTQYVKIRKSTDEYINKFENFVKSLTELTNVRQIDAFLMKTKNSSNHFISAIQIVSFLEYFVKSNKKCI